MGTSHLSLHIQGMLAAMTETAVSLAGIAGAPSPSLLPSPFDSLVSLDAPSSYEPGAKARPYVSPALTAKMSAHGALRITHLHHDAEGHRAFVQAAITSAPGLAGWCTGLRVGIDPRGRTTAWIDDRSTPTYPRVLCNRLSVHEATSHLEALVRAASYCDPASEDEPERWIWRSHAAHGADTRPYVAAGEVDAVLLGLGFYAPRLVRDALLGKPVKADVARHCPVPDAHLRIKARRDAVDSSRKTSGNRTPLSPATSHSGQRVGGVPAQA